MAGDIEPGAVTPGLIAEHIADLVTVAQAEIRSALQYLAAERGHVAEGAGAVTVAWLDRRRWRRRLNPRTGASGPWQSRSLLRRSP